VKKIAFLQIKSRLDISKTPCKSQIEAVSLFLEHLVFGKNDVLT
jgi:hypothetical protein